MGGVRHGPAPFAMQSGCQSGPRNGPRIGPRKVCFFNALAGAEAAEQGIPGKDFPASRVLSSWIEAIEDVNQTLSI